MPSQYPIRKLAAFSGGQGHVALQADAAHTAQRADPAALITGATGWSASSTTFPGRILTAGTGINKASRSHPGSRVKACPASEVTGTVSTTARMASLRLC
jgi:hypothetical protein